MVGPLFPINGGSHCNDEATEHYAEATRERITKELKE